jgi:Tol biopolymer transport system component
VLTQWFERARFEWHPGKPDQFKVLLGLLGNELLRSGTGPGERPPGRIAFVQARDIFTSGDIYIMNPDGSQQTRLTTDVPVGLENTQLVWSPAGDRIAFQAQANLYVMQADGSRRISFASQGVYAPNPVHPQYFSPAWSPDGTFLAFVWRGDIYASRLDGSAPIRITTMGTIGPAACLSWASSGYLAFGGAGRIYVVRSDGGDVRDLGVGECPAWSPVAERLAFVREGAIWVTNRDGSGASHYVVPHQGNSLRRGPWSPDGRRILAVSLGPNNEYQRDIFAVDIAGGAAQQLTTDPDLDDMPSWSPDGQYIAFASKRTRRYGVYIMRADGTNQTLLPASAESAVPAWAPR